MYLKIANKYEMQLINKQINCRKLQKAKHILPYF